MRPTPPVTGTHRGALVVDPQNDFTEGGALAVEGGDAACRRIGAYLASHGNRYDLIVFTSDWHIDPGPHFAGDQPPDFVDTWPVHCAAATAGAALDDELLVGAAGAGLVLASPLGLADAIVYKGHHAAAYSAFEAAVDDDPDLAAMLRRRGVTQVDVMGIATSHCVRATALDAATAGFDTTVLTDLCVGVRPELARAALDELGAAGVAIAESAGVAGPRS